jgi:hypothetical protein
MGIGINPDFNWQGFAGNALQDLGYGLATGNSLGNAFGQMAKRNAELGPDRQASAEKRSQTNATLAYFKAKGYDDLAQRAAAGEPMGQLYQEAIQRSTPAAPDTYNLSPGEGHYVDGKLVASMPANSGSNTPAAIEEYQFAVSQGYKGTFQQYETDMRKAGATNLTFNNDQANAAGFADRMKAAEPILQKTESVQADAWQHRGDIPGIGNFIASPEYQQAQQAQRDFVNAVLRKESGAAISDAEFENARKQYFPQPGDSPQVIEQKRQNRAIAIASMERSGGPAYGNPAVPPAAIGGTGDPDLDRALQQYGQ